MTLVTNKQDHLLHCGLLLYELSTPENQPLTVDILVKGISSLNGKLLTIRWEIAGFLFAIFIAFILVPPNIDPISFSDDYSSWPTVERQIESPFQPLGVHHQSHAAKKVFRLTVPLLARIFHLDRYGIFVAQTATFFIMILLGLTLARRITGDRLLSILFVGGMVPTYLFFSSYHDTTGHLDAFAFLFLFAAMTARHPVSVFVFCTLASWCDERAFLANSGIFFWWYIQDAQNQQFSDLFRLRMPNSSTRAVLISIICYVVTRFALTRFTPLELKMTLDDFFLVKHYWSLLPELTIYVFSGLWIVIAIGLFTALRQRNPIYVLAITIPLFVAFGVSCMVWDFSRSLTFAFPVIFIALFVLNQYAPLKKVSKAIILAFVFALFIPRIHFDSQVNKIKNLYTVVTERQTRTEQIAKD